MQSYWIWLASRQNVTNREKWALVQHFSDIEALYRAAEDQLPKDIDLRPESIPALLDKDLSGAEQILRDCAEAGVNILPISDPDYPQRLKNIYDPPVVLYYKGVLPDWDARPVIGVVGTRHPSGYGRNAAYRLGFEISMCGGLVVSGMALGVDAAAMNGAITAKKETVGVLGCGADIIYPRANAGLFADTERFGCILSEYAPGVPPAKWSFPQRNRIISGLSCGVVVVEAPEKSGSLITARQAADQGRDVFAVPGNIDMPGFVGSNRLLRSGAIAVGTGWDVISEYALQYPGVVSQSREIAPAMHETSAPKVAQKPRIPDTQPNNGEKNNRKTIDKAPSAPYIDLTENLSGLSPDERAIVTALGEEEKLVDDVIAECGLSAGKVLSLLTLLEIRGIITRHPGRRISLKTGKR